MEPIAPDEPSPSEASNIYAASQVSPHCRDISGLKQNQKNVVKLLQPPIAPPLPPKTSSSRVVLDLNLSNNDSIRGSKLELNLSSQPNMASSHDQNTNRDDEDGQKSTKIFSCKICRREFSTSQALGGHQNAHKQEIAMAKRRQDLNHMGTFGHYPYYPYSALSSHPLYGTFNRPTQSGTFNRPTLGMRMNSLIHKPLPYSLPVPANYRYEQSGWYRQGLITQNEQPSSFKRLSLEGLSGGLSGTASSSSSTSSNLHRRDSPEDDKSDTSEIDLSLKL